MREPDCFELTRHGPCLAQERVTSENSPSLRRMVPRHVRSAPPPQAMRNRIAGSAARAVNAGKCGLDCGLRILVQHP